VFDLIDRLRQMEYRSVRLAQDHQDRGRPNMAKYNRGMRDAFREVLELLEEISRDQENVAEVVITMHLRVKDCGLSATKENSATICEQCWPFDT